MSRAIQVFFNRHLVIGVVVAIVMSIVIAPFVARRLRIALPAAYAAVLTTTAILAITIFERAEGIPRFDPVQALTWWTSQRQSVVDVARTEAAWWLNVALFIPAGIVWSGITRRPLIVAAALGAFSFSVETVQGLTSFGAADLTDLVANTIGGTLGALGIAVVLWLAPRAIPDVSRAASASDALRFDPKWVIGTLVATALAIGICFSAVHGVLVLRQRALRGEVESNFAGMTIQQVNEIREPDAAGISSFFGLISVRPDSYLFLDDDRPVEVRYPVDFLGAYRCVFVTFSDAPPTFTNGSGKECTEERYDSTEE